MYFQRKPSFAELFVGSCTHPDGLSSRPRRHVTDRMMHGEPPEEG
jgi:hypothetical protein